MASWHHIYAARARQAMLGLLLLALLPLTLWAEEVPVPAPLQVKLLLKALTFDRNFSQKISTTVLIGIVYDPKNPAANQAQRDITRILDQLTIKKLPIKYVRLHYRGEATFGQLAKQHNIHVFYVMPGNADYLQELLRVSQMHQISTVTGVPAYVEQGVAVGVDVQRNRSKLRPRILINLPASKSQGSAYEARLLKMATVLK